MGPRIGLDAVEKTEILLCRESNQGRPARSQSLYRLNCAEYLCKTCIERKMYVPNFFTVSVRNIFPMIFAQKLI
jgi:hypothetical protein